MSNKNLIFSMMFAVSLPVFSYAQSKSLEYQKKEIVVPVCPQSREWVTLIQFLRDQKDIAMPEKEILSVAMSASAGCEGAAARFVSAYEVLMKAGLRTRDAVSYGMKSALSSPETHAAFTSAFLTLFSSDGLDLTQADSLKLASALSHEWPGSVEQMKFVKEDFLGAAQLCSENSNFQVGKMECAEFSKNVALSGQDYDRGALSDTKKVLKYLSQSLSHELKRTELLNSALMIVKSGKGSYENFVDAYEFAIKKKGLEKSSQDAFALALEITQKAGQHKHAKDSRKTN